MNRMKISTHFEKKRIMFSLLLIIVLVGTYSVKADLMSNKTKGSISAIYSELSLKKLIKLASEKFSVLGQEAPLFFFPQFPQRLMYVASEISEVSEKLVDLNEKLNKFTNQYRCEYAHSQCKQEISTGGPASCKSVGVFGNPSPISIPAEELETSVDPERLENAEGLSVKEIQAQIENTSDELSYLQELLKKEMESGLEKQLQTLREDDAKAIRDNLNKLLELGPKLAEPVKKNLSLPDECSVEKCNPNCQQGGSFTLEACLKTGVGEQKPMEAKFGAGASLEDLNLGKVKIKNINISLPEEIEMPELPELPSLTISVPDITLTCPTESKSITIQTPTPTLPDAPALTLSCPQYPNYSSYQCSVSPNEESKNYNEADWYFQTFSWLSEKCQELPGMKDDRGIPREEKINKCLKIEEVSQTVINECNSRWNEYLSCFILCPKPPEICQQIGPESKRNDKAVEWCKELFQQEGQIPPAACSSEPIGTTRQKCGEIKNTEREELPLSCKLLPLFIGKLEDPSAGTILGQAKNCSAQTIGDYPEPAAGCSLAFPSAPKISFPKIIIPDIHLPSFNFPPFFRVKLPNFIFEDLVLPDLDLCNLDDCQFQFPYLSFKVPSLKIPQVEVPPAQIDIPGGPQLEVKVAPIQFPPLSFQFPQLFNLGSLATPELEMPKIPLPQPKLQFSFKGVKIDLLNLLLGLFNIPSSLCASLDIKFVPINIVYPDYILSWIAFPRVPEIPFCKDTRQFCKDAKGSIQEVTNKTTQIQNQVNAVFQNKIQQELDILAKKIQQEIQQEIQQQLNEISQKIEQAITAHIATYAPEYSALPPPETVPVPGVLPVGKALPCDKIPALTISMDDIVISSIPLKELTDFPDKIQILWPDSLKKIALSGDLGYELPTVFLSRLSYLKDVTVGLPGLQRSSPSINFNLLQNAAACLGQPPSGGNPCPTGEIQSNLEEIKRIRDEVQQASQNIKNVLE